MVECHGTGTKIGDPIKTKAVADVSGGYGIHIGSVKPNLGHSEGASGLSSMIKMVLTLEYKIIPSNINFKTLNLAILWKEAKLKVLINPTLWSADHELVSTRLELVMLTHMFSLISQHSLVLSRQIPQLPLMMRINLDSRLFCKAPRLVTKVSGKSRVIPSFSP